MSNEAFMSAVQKLTEHNFSLSELITTAEQIRKESGLAPVSQLYNLWLQLNPTNPQRHVAYFNMAVTLSDNGQFEEAKQALLKAIEIAPDFYPPYINIGTVLERMGQAGEAVIQWSTLSNKLALVTGHSVNFKVLALKQIGRVLETNQLLPNAESVLKQSLEINNNQLDVIQHYVALRLGQCEWPIIQSSEGIDRKVLMKGTGPLSMAVYTDDPMLQMASAWNYNRNFIGYPTLDLYDKHQHRAGPRPAKLRIGYVSSDLRNHAIGFIMAEMFEMHDRNKYEIFAYYCGVPYEDALKDRIKNTIDTWVDIRDMKDEAAAQRILDDKIDILIDVNGYTKDARTKVFAMRPAPIIVNWLGYPGTMASPYHHYIIADDWIIPEGSEHYYTEKVLRLPCYQPNDRKRMVSLKRPTRKEVGLPENAFVFCSFNGAQKISRFTFDRWMRILQAVPDSVLWLLDGNHETIRDRLRQAAAERGVAGERLIFAGKAANPEHLVRYPLADLFLDNSPYGAHVTASDALWMGVPIVTFAGRGFAARVCSGLVRAAGLPELVCDSPEAFEKRAIALATTERAELKRLRKKLEDNRESCVLFDTDSLVEHLEGLYEVMWDDYRKGQLPRPNLTNLDAYLDIGAEFDHDAAELLVAKDYEGMYRTVLAKRHHYCALPADARLWTEADIANAEGGNVAASGTKRNVLKMKKSG